MPAAQKTLVVFGATGYQGGSVVEYFLQQPSSPYHIRAITRDPSSAKAKALASAGAEVVQADLDDEYSIRSAISGAHAVFLVTNFWANPTEPQREKDQAKRAFKICSESSSLEHLVWSSLPSIANASGGKYKNVFHYDGKAEATEYLEKELKNLWVKTTVLWLGPYYQLWLQFPALFAPKKKFVNDEEVWVQTSAAGERTAYPIVDVNDTGLVVAAILANGKGLGGKTIAMVGEDTYSLGEVLKIWGKAMGKNTAFQQMDDEQNLELAKSLGFPDFLTQDIVEVNLTFRDYSGLLYKQNDAIPASEILLEGQKMRPWEEYVKTENWTELLKG